MVGLFKIARMGPFSTGKCTSGMTEKMALKKRFGNGSDIHRYKRAFRIGTAAMNPLRKQFFAGTGFTGNQHWLSPSRHNVRIINDLAHARAFGDHVRKTMWQVFLLNTCLTACLTGQ